METYNYLTTVNVLRSWVFKRPDDVFIVDENKTYSFKEFDKVSNRFANWLASIGVGKGDNIGVLLNNNIELLISLIAAHKVGAILNLWNFRLSSQDISKLISFVDAKVVIYEPEFWDRVEVSSNNRTYLCVGKAAAGVSDFYAALSSCSIKSRTMN